MLIAFPFSDGGTKRRPALVLGDTDDDILVARITSYKEQYHRGVLLQDWQHEGLLLPSIARVDKIATIEKSFVERVLGEMSNNDKRAVAQALQTVFEQWLTIL